MRRLIVTAVAAAALLVAATASAALVPWTYALNPADAGCVTSTFSGGVLHLAKNCPTPTVVSAGATITGVSGTFSSASFTLSAASVCNGGSPRFNVVMTNGTTSTTNFLGCNNVIPTTNADGTRTYTFTAATIAAGGNQVAVPSGTITSVDIVLDVQGTADLSNITFNGQAEVPSVGHGAQNACKHGGWKSMTSPSFRNQGQCVSYFNHQNHAQDHQGNDQRGHDDDD
jgi:hypothetical protein